MIQISPPLYIFVLLQVIRGVYASSQIVDKKEYKRKRDNLRALASSCLPLFFDSSLWNIGTIEGSTQRSYPEVLPRTFHGNACVIISVLKVALAFLDVMGRDSTILTHQLLCPIIEKASQRNNRMVCDIAKETCVTLATALDFGTLSDMIEQNLSTVFFGLVDRFRSPEWTTTPNEKSLRDALNSVRWVLLHTNVSEEGVRVVADFLAFIEAQLDRLAICNSLSSNIIQDVVTLHQTFFEHIYGFFPNNYSQLITTSARLKRKSGIWTDALSPYKNSPLNIVQERDFESEEPPPPSDPNIYSAGVQIISRVISRESLILSNSNLALQVAACKTLSLAYETLARFSPKAVSTSTGNLSVGQHEGRLLKYIFRLIPSTGN